MIDEQIVTIQISPLTRNWKSNITLGGVPDGLITGLWYEHSLTPIDDPNFSEQLMMLGLKKIALAD